MSDPWTPGPLRYEAGVVYLDRGIQPHVARMFQRDDMDQMGQLFAAAPELVEALDRTLVWLGAAPHWLGDDIRALLARIRGEAP